MVQSKQHEQLPQVDEAQRAEADQLQDEIDDVVAGRAAGQPATLRDRAERSAAEHFRNKRD